MLQALEALPSAASTLAVTGNLTIANATDTLYTTNSTNTSGTGTINIGGNLSHSNGVLGKSSIATATGTIAFTGTQCRILLLRALPATLILL